MNAKLTAVKNVVTSKTARQILKVQKHSPEILFAGGVVGVVATAVAAGKNTLKVEAALAEHKENERLAKETHLENPEVYPAKDYARDLAVLKVRKATSLVQVYAPTIVIGAATVCLFGQSHRILTQRNAGLVAAYAALDKGFREYRGRVTEAIGPEREAEIRFGVEEREIAVDNEDGTTEVKVVRNAPPSGASIYARYFDEYSANWERHPGRNAQFIRSQQNYANDLLRARGHLFLNEVYDMLGLSHTKEGAVVGWVMDKERTNYVDFGVFDSNIHDAKEFVCGRNNSVLLDFNVDGTIWDKI